MGSPAQGADCSGTGGPVPRLGRAVDRRVGGLAPQQQVSRLAGLSPQGGQQLEGGGGAVGMGNWLIGGGEAGQGRR